MANSILYQVQANEPALYTEIYLPKKAKLQEILYNTLTSGFKRSTIMEYFTELNKPENEEKLARVRELSSPGWTVLRENLSPKEIAMFPRLFYGYSMYQVEGVFLKEIADKPDDPDENYMPIEELNQVIRIIFKYECASKTHDVINYLKAAFRDPLSEIGTIEENYSDQKWIKQISPEAQSALQEFYLWIRYVGWFLYGFLLYQICEEIVRLHKDETGHEMKSNAEGMTKESSIKQDEIWVTGLWNMNVNVIKWSQRIEPDQVLQ